MHILIIDDEPGFAEVLGELLQDAGHSVVCALGGKDGVALAAAAAPDVVLVDIMMPNMDGFEVIVALRAQHAPCIVALTCVPETAVKARASVDACLLKPVTATLLLQTLAALTPHAAKPAP